MTTETRPVFRFGAFELDCAAYQLRHDGAVIRLERQPLDLLILLVERRGALVTRAEIVARLWGPDVFVEVEAGVHTAVRKVRQALRDPAGSPRFIETVAGRGYRFIAEVTSDSGSGGGADGSAGTSATSEPPPVLPGRADRRHFMWLGLVVAILLATGGWTWWRAARSSPGAGAPVRLAILPFDNLTGDPAYDYVADGLTEEVIAWMGQVDPEHLEVVGRTSVMTYKHKAPPLADIGRTLGADYLIEGAVRAAAGRLRVTSRLLRSEDQVQVWSEAYDREAGDMLALQQDLSRTIAAQVSVRVAPERLQQLERRQTRSPEAYELYLRSRDYARQRTPLGSRRAVEYLRRALAIDDGYALAWATLAHTLGAATLNSDVLPAAIRGEALEGARRAVAADPSLPDAQFAAAYVRWVLECDYPGAEAGLRRALALDPSHSFTSMVLAHVLSQLGRHAEARRQATRARELDPLNAIFVALSSQIEHQAGDPVRAVELARRAIALEPDLWIGHMMLGQALERLDEPAAAIEALSVAGRLSDQNSKSLSLRGYILARAGRQAEAREVLAALRLASETRYIPPFALALVHLGLDERGEALAELERSARLRDPHVMYLSVDPKWSPLGGESRFTAILAGCGLRHVNN